MKEHKVYVDLYHRYFVFDKKYRMTDFHIFMISVCMDIINKSSTFHRMGGRIELVVIKDYNIDNRLPDLYTPFFDVECETGLKSSYKDLIGRILSTRKTVIVVLPNDNIKARYIKHISVRKWHLKIVTMAEFQKAVYDTLRDYKPALE